MKCKNLTHKEIKEMTSLAESVEDAHSRRIAEKILRNLQIGKFRITGENEVTMLMLSPDRNIFETAHSILINKHLPSEYRTESVNGVAPAIIKVVISIR